MIKSKKEKEISNMNYDKYDFSYATKDYKTILKKGINEDIVRQISKIKEEPEWMTEIRLRSLKSFSEKPMPQWGADLNDINFDEITYYMNPSDTSQKKWEDVPEYVKETFDKLGIPEAERKFLAGVGAQFDCLTADTIIFTSQKGPKNITDIKKGDKVFSWDNKTNNIKIVKVKNIWCAGKKNIFELKTKSRNIKASNNHPFLSVKYEKLNGKKKGSYKLEWIPLKNLKKNDLIAIIKSYPNKNKSFKLKHPKIITEAIGKNQFGAIYKLNISHSYKKVSLPTKSNEDLMWLFGFYLGDGYILHTKNRRKSKVSFAVPENQKELIKSLETTLKKLFKYELKGKYEYYVTIYSTIIANFFEENGFYGKAKTKKVPEWVFSLPQSELISFLAGYIDSDGSVRDHPKNHDVILTSANFLLLESIKKIAAYCGLESSNIFSFSSITKGKKYQGFRVVLSGNIKKIPCRHPIKAERLLKQKFYHSYSTIRGGRKNFAKFCNDFIGFTRVEEIIPLNEELTYDIEIEGTHNYIANGLIVHNSEVIYHNLHKDLEDKGVIFLSMDEGLKKYPELVKKYFGTVIPLNDNKFAALNTAVWSGGSFVYVPKNVNVTIPLQAYFRINASQMGQFERTLIIADENSSVHYVEGCSAPRYSSQSLHSAVVEIIALPRSSVRYTTIQNWAPNIYNLVTKRAHAYKDASVFWIDGNLGSKITMKYPAIHLLEEGAKGEVLSIALAGKDQHQDAGAKVLHFAPNTTSTITSKSISKNNGRATYRGLLKVFPGAYNVKSSVRCDALLLNEESRTDTYPNIEIDEPSATITHEATVGKIGEEQIFYLTSRGLSEEEALTLIVLGFIQPFTKSLPMEYAVELNRLIELEMEGSVG